jgi:hypothetical protein
MRLKQLSAGQMSQLVLFLRSALPAALSPAREILPSHHLHV